MYVVNSSGPNTEPCGNPHFMLVSLDYTPFIETHWGHWHQHAFQEHLWERCDQLYQRPHSNQGELVTQSFYHQGYTLCHSVRKARQFLHCDFLCVQIALCLMHININYWVLGSVTSQKQCASCYYDVHYMEWSSITGFKSVQPVER